MTYRLSGNSVVTTQKLNNKNLQLTFHPLGAVLLPAGHVADVEKLQIMMLLLTTLDTLSLAHHSSISSLGLSHHPWLLAVRARLASRRTTDDVTSGRSLVAAWPRLLPLLHSLLARPLTSYGRLNCIAPLSAATVSKVCASSLPL